MDKNKYLPRLIDERIKLYLSTFGAVCIEGPKWCGKTWTGYIYGQRTTDPAVVLAEMQTTMVALQGDGSDVVEDQLKAMFDN